MKRIGALLITTGLLCASSANADSLGASFTLHTFTLAQAKTAALVEEHAFWKHDGIGPILAGGCHWRTNHTAICTIIAPDFPFLQNGSRATVSWRDAVTHRHHRWIISAADR